MQRRGDVARCGRMGMMFILSCTVAAALPAAEPSRDESVEPPLEFSLEIGDRKLPVTLDKSFILESDGGRENATLRVKPTRHFRYGQLSLRYPRYYTFEADLSDPEVSMWILSGNSNVIMLLRYPDRTDKDELLDEMLATLREQYGQENVKTGDASITLDERRLKGSRLQVRLAGEIIRQEIFSFASSDAGYVVVFQDTPNDLGRASREAVIAKELLTETFQFPR